MKKTETIRIDSSQCTSLTEGGAFIGKEKFFDVWKYHDLLLESGNIYALVGEYGMGGMFLSYLLGGKIDFGNLKIYVNEKEIQKHDLELISWNLEPRDEKYGNFIVEKSILKALRQNKSKENFSNIKNKFILTSSKAGTKLKNLSGERWRASAALGYVMGRQIFYAPYNTSQFYYHMCQSGLLKALRELTDAGAIVLLPVGSDEFIKYIADLCIYIQTPHYDIESLRQKYNGLINAGD